MNPWQQQPGPNWGAPPPGPPQQPYPPGYQPQPHPHQPYPHPGFPPGYQQQTYPQLGYPPPGYPNAAPRPAGSGTAVTAIVLSSLIALFQLLACIGYLALGSELSEHGNPVREWVPGFLYFEGLARLLVAAVLVVGAVLLARRKSAGRWVTAGAAIAVLVLQLVEYGVRSGFLPTSGASPLSTLSSVILPITLIIVVLTGATRRWLDEGRPRR